MKHIAVFTSGGDAPGMNAGIRAVVRTARQRGLDVSGIRRGFRGMLEDDVFPMTSRDVGGILSHGGTILHSARCEAFREKAGRVKAAENLKKRDIDAVVAIGGDGTYRGLYALQEEHGIRCVGMPGTIDNDIGGTDYTIGFDTALNTAVRAIDQLRDTAESHDRLFFIEVMGRTNGHIATFAGIGGGAEEVLVPEEPTDIEALVKRIDVCCMQERRSIIIVVSEGDDAGDANTIAGLVAERMNRAVESRVTVLGHIQRGGSPTAFDRLLASRLGVRAVDALLDGQTGIMVGLERNDPVVRPLSDAWDVDARVDPAYFELMRMLSS